jgi:DNA-directed RNA polymerase specialized sigma24 family protein
MAPWLYRSPSRRRTGRIPIMALSQGSVTTWFQALQDGDRDGAQKLWERFSRRLVGLARQRLRHTPRQAADEEDVVLSAFDSFCRGAENGRFTQLHDRDDLWLLLVTITVRKAIDHHQHEHRLKRAGAARTDASAVRNGPTLEDTGLDALLSREPTPELAAMVAEECDRLLGRLADPELCSIALFKMEGYTDDEIAARLDCARRTVQRRLRLIRQLWEQEAT